MLIRIVLWARQGMRAAVTDVQPVSMAGVYPEQLAL